MVIVQEAVGEEPIALRCLQQVYEAFHVQVEVEQTALQAPLVVEEVHYFVH